MLETLYGDLGSVGGFYSCVSYQLAQLSQICEVQFGTISPHFVILQVLKLFSTYE